MKRIDTGTSQLNKHGAGKSGFNDGSVAGTEPTDLDATWFDSVQEEISLVVEASGQTLDGTVYSQLRTALRIAAAKTWSQGAAEAIGASGAPLTNAIAGSSKYWVACGDADATDAVLAATTDAGTGWLHTAGTGTTNNLNGVSYDLTNDLFIIVGDAGYIATASVPTGTWTEQAATAATTFNCVHSSDAGVTVAAGAHSGSAIFANRSVDGTTWVACATPPPSSTGDRVNSLVSYGTTWVAVGQTSGLAPLIWRSTDDGDTWSTVTPSGSEELESITHDGNVFVAMGRGGEIVTSATGESGTWTTYAGPTFSGAFQLASDPVAHIIIATSNSGGGSSDHFQMSIDGGATWAPTNTPWLQGGSGDLGAIAFNGSAFATAWVDQTTDTIHGAQTAHGI